MLITIKRTIIALVTVAAVLATAVAPAMAAGPKTQVIVVHITDGSNKPASLVDDDQSTLVEGTFITVDEEGVSAWGQYTDADGNAYGWGAGPDGVHAEQRELGDTATGLLTADRNCDTRHCHIVLVNYQQPKSKTDRLAAKKAADKLMADGHRLHTIAVDPDARHLGFNWHLSGQGYNTSPDGVAELVAQITDYTFMVTVAELHQGTRSNQSLAEQWDSLSRIEKIWLNPLNCDLNTQWLSAYDGTCHNKS